MEKTLSLALERENPFLCERKVDCAGVMRLFNLSRLLVQSVPCTMMMPTAVFLLIPIMFLLFKLWSSAS